MSYSGIVVRVNPAGLEAMADCLAGLEGVQVHQRHPESGRMILTLQADTADEEVAGLSRIQRVPGVVSADLVYHRLPQAHDPGMPDRPSQNTDAQRGET